VSPPETRARELLAELPSYIWDGRSLPVPVETIADSHLGLLICEADDLTGVAPGLPQDAHLSGLLLPGRREVWINRAEAQESPGRRRFTIGHELGHWELHRHDGEAVYCRGSLAHAADPDEQTTDIEEEASLFAATLMFPDELVREQWQRHRDLTALCERFGGSRVATERAIFRAVRRPAVLGASPELECFCWQDAEYQAFRDAHPHDGYLVTDYWMEPERTRVHRMDCSYLTGPPRPGQPQTRTPKWWSADVGELRRVFREARDCSRCRP
jgi:hypothetical protein